MAGDDNLETRRLWLQVKLGQIVQHIDRNAGELDHFGLPQFASPRTFVDISSDRSHRGESCELAKNFGISDIAGVDDVFRVTQCINGLRSQQAVCIGDDADLNGRSALLLGVLSRAHQLIDLRVGKRSVHEGVGALRVYLLRETAQQTQRCPHRARTQADSLHAHRR
jgi:hypothetical protein